ncbi:MAG TPA: heparan-alpha-glucosaminide N-acetyltransferase domain-containing protein [Gemmatimonadales bacterium]|nr:heparan-alpha-glucosaminide N-acetyltransferase domain-containing protein [Gemmatimonadales bacterium]
MSATALAEADVVRPHAEAVGPGRVGSVDMLRGLIMVLMALDHVRDYFTNVPFSPTDLTQTSTALFLTRWITHFCAPGFVFLAGTSAFFRGARGRSRGELSRYLLTRGLWLVVLELTVSRTGWMFNLDYTNEPLILLVLWAIGVSMIVLAGLVWLPLPAVAAAGVVMISGHNALDGIRPEALGAWGPLWAVLHVQAAVPLAGGRVLFVAYPLVPWIGVMAAGYAFGALFSRPADERRRLFLRLGIGLALGFLVLRAANLYGDPSPWTEQASPARTLLSFLNTTKYPPSLLFLLMTLGPAIILLPALERLSGPPARFLGTIGRVPLFYYLLHIYLIHATALAVGTLAGFPPSMFLTLWARPPEGWGYPLPVVYLVWAGVVLALYPACRWFAAVKARRRDAWLGYL